MVRQIAVVSYDPNWLQMFEDAADELSSILGEEVITLHHIGSTAIPGIVAKPIIDILIAVRDIYRIDGFNQMMTLAGYEPKGENGIPGRRYFRRIVGEQHTHHVHVFQQGNGAIERHLAFRDYMIADPNDARAYGNLKEELARRFPTNSRAYTEAKSDFIADIDRKAAAWVRCRNAGGEGDAPTRRDPVPRKRVEEVALNAWPALHNLLYDGWILRFANGYTKRANSVNPLYASTLDVEAKIDFCEAAYRARGLRPIFRLLPFSEPQELDRALASRGYVRFDPSLVLHLELAGWQHPSISPHALRDERLADWMAVYCRLSGADPEAHRTHGQMLERIGSARLLTTFVVEGKAVACGLGVLEDRFFGLFDLVSAPALRGRGHGTRLVATMLHWARERGAMHAYLQVVARNDGARRFYGRLGFAEAYPYWYRVPAE